MTKNQPLILKTLALSSLARFVVRFRLPILIGEAIWVHDTDDRLQVKREFVCGTNSTEKLHLKYLLVLSKMYMTTGKM